MFSPKLGHDHIAVLKQPIVVRAIEKNNHIYTLLQWRGNFKPNLTRQEFNFFTLGIVNK